MKLKLNVTKVDKVEVEVEFPIYSKNENSGEYSHCVIYNRLDENGLLVTCIVTKEYGDNEVAYEVKLKPRVALCSASDSELGKGEYACTVEEFNKALSEAIEFTNTLLVIPK